MQSGLSSSQGLPRYSILCIFILDSQWPLGNRFLYSQQAEEMESLMFNKLPRTTYPVSGRDRFLKWRSLTLDLCSFYSLLWPVPITVCLASHNHTPSPQFRLPSPLAPTQVSFTDGTTAPLPGYDNSLSLSFSISLSCYNHGVC